MPRRSERATASADPILHWVWLRCDGQRTVGDVAAEFAREFGRDTSDARSALAAALAQLRHEGGTENITATVLRLLQEELGPDLGGRRLADICTADYFTAVRLDDGRQGAAINFHNVTGPHQTTFDHDTHDRNLLAAAADDPLLLRSHLSAPRLDCLAQSVRVAILNALSEPRLTRVDPHYPGLSKRIGYLDLYARLRPGDRVAMIGCTGNYSCPEIGRADFLAKVEFSDFEYTDPFKPGIEACIKEFFRRPETVVLSDGTRNEAICQEADVVVIIADTLCTETLDELLAWSNGAREVLVTGRSYAMNPTALFARGATATCSQQILEPDFVGFVRRKLARQETGFTDALVQCFQRIYFEPDIAGLNPTQAAL
jgi:uncharacterized protein (DUF4213/DUF364 family)